MGFSQEWMNTLFDGQNKALVALFVDTLKIALERIENAKDRQYSEAQLTAELDKILQSSEYLGIDSVADHVAAMKKKISAGLDSWKDGIDVDLLILKQIVSYWGNSSTEPSIMRLQDERAILAEFGKEDAELLQIYLDMLVNNLRKIEEKISGLKDGQDSERLLSELKEIFSTLDIATNFMNYPELSVIMKEGLITVGNRVNENEFIAVNGLIKIYNSLMDNLNIQFSKNDKIKNCCEKIELLEE